MSKFGMLPISQLIKAEWNYKEEDNFMAEKLKENIKLNGQVENIIVREIGSDTYEVVNGNHRLDALLDLGFENVMCFNCGDITKEQAIRLAIETNETKFPNDSMKLAEIIKNISSTFSIEDLKTTMPYTSDELNFFTNIEDLEIDLPEINLPDTDDKEDKPKVNSIECPHCGEEIKL